MDTYSVKLSLSAFLLCSLSVPSMAVEPPKSSCTVAYRPAGVASVFPPEKSVYKQGSSIGATFRFRRELKADIESFRLFLDGIDVTAKSRFSGSRDQPPSLVHIAHTPKISVPGDHQVKVTFRTTDGVDNCYQWSFQVKKS